MGYYRNSLKDTCKVLGEQYRGYNIIPTDKIFYDEFQYKLTFQGNQFHYDIIFFNDLQSTLNKHTYHYRIQTTSKNINVYFHDKTVLDAVIDQYQHTDYLENITAIIDQEHLEGLLDFNTEFVYRNKYWYGIYPIKITFFRNYNCPENFCKGIREFIEGSFGEYRLFDSYTDNWYSNYLWVTQEEYDKGYPFLKLSYGDFIERIQKIRLMEKNNGIF